MSDIELRTLSTEKGPDYSRTTPFKGLEKENREGNFGGDKGNEQSCIKNQ